MSHHRNHTNAAPSQATDDQVSPATKARGKTDFLYQHATDRMLELLERGVVPWHRPWARQQNIVNGTDYRGVNQLLLGFAGRTSPFWMTFKQMQEIGGRLKEDDRHTQMVLFWKFFDGRDGRKVAAGEAKPATETETSDERRNRPPLLMYYRVFNLDQVEFEDRDTIPGKIRPLIERVSAGRVAANGGEAVFESILTNCPQRPVIQDQIQDKAFYAIDRDFVNIPPRGAFPDQAEYYSTLFHELGHWTGPRLGREMEGYSTHRRGDVYSREELVAELVSAFASNEAGILGRTEENSAAYLHSWAQHLRSDPKCIVKAAGQAQRAFDYLMGRQHQDQPAAMPSIPEAIGEVTEDDSPL